MRNRFLFKFFMLLYGHIYYQTLRLKVFGMKDPPSQVRFSALGQAAILLTMNVMAVVFMVAALLNAIGLEIPSWLKGRTIGVALFSLWVAFFLIFKKLTAEFNRYYDQIKDAENSKPLQRFVSVYQYVVFGVFAVSIVSLIM